MASEIHVALSIVVDAAKALRGGILITAPAGEALRQVRLLRPGQK